MARAVAIVTDGRPGADRLQTFDTQDTVEGSVTAARAALAAGARMLMGPLRSEQTVAVLGVTRDVPVVTFSNDETLADLGAFVLGITPAQSVAAILSYARNQGLRRVALLAADTPFGQASAAAMRALAPAAGLTLTATALRDPGAPGALVALRDGAGAPDAVYLPDGGAALTGFARDLRGNGLQLLGSVQWGLGEVTTNPDLSGAWFAAAPPDLFVPFADRFAALHGTTPGIIATLAHDAALVALGLSDIGALNRRGLLRAEGFVGALGPFRFRPDGRASRDLAVLTISNGAYALLAEVTGS
jgi:ABC-type branched-subunit amino acid transport system substrate-binding protein